MAKKIYSEDWRFSRGKEEKEFRKIEKLIKEKKADKLGEWLAEFGKPREKYFKNDWL